MAAKDAEPKGPAGDTIVYIQFQIPGYPELAGELALAPGEPVNLDGIVLEAHELMSRMFVQTKKGN